MVLIKVQYNYLNLNWPIRSRYAPESESAYWRINLSGHKMGISVFGDASDVTKIHRSWSDVADVVWKYV